MKKQRTLYFLVLVLVLVLSLLVVTACSDPKAVDDDTDVTAVDGTKDVNDADNLVSNGTFAAAYNTSETVNYLKNGTITGWTKATGSAVGATVADNGTTNTTAYTTFDIKQGVVDLATWGESRSLNHTVYGTDTLVDAVDFGAINVNTNSNKPYADTNALMIASDMSDSDIYDSSSYFYSSAIKVEKGKNYRLSIDVLTLLLNGNNDLDTTSDNWNSEDYGKGAYVLLTSSGTGSTVYNKVEAINTYGSWKTVNLYLEGNAESDTTFYVQLWMGHGPAYVQGYVGSASSGVVNERLTKGICLFDNVILKETTSEDYANQVTAVANKVAAGETNANSAYSATGTVHVTSFKDWMQNEKYAAYTANSKNNSSSYAHYYTARTGNPSAYTVFKGIDSNADTTEYSSSELPYYSSSKYLPYGIFDYSKIWELAEGGKLTDGYYNSNLLDWAAFPSGAFYNSNNVFDNNAFVAKNFGYKPTDTNALIIYNYKPSAVGYESSETLTVEKDGYYNIDFYVYLYQVLKLDETDATEAKKTELSKDDVDANMTRLTDFNDASRIVTATVKLTEVTFDGSAKTAEYNAATAFAAYLADYKTRIAADASIPTAIKDLWAAWSDTDSFPAELEYYYTVYHTSGTSNYYKIALGSVGLPYFAAGDWTRVEYDIKGNALGNRELGLQLWLGEGLAEAASLVMGGAMFSDIVVSKDASAQAGVTYAQLSSFNAGEYYDYLGLTSGVLFDAAGEFSGSITESTIAVAGDVYVRNATLNGDKIYKIDYADVVGTVNTGSHKIVVKGGTDVTYYYKNGVTALYEDVNCTVIASESSIAETSQMIKAGTNYYYYNNGKLYATDNGATVFAVDASGVTIAGTLYTYKSAAELKKSLSEYNYNLEYADGLYAQNNASAWVATSGITKAAWEGDATLSALGAYPYLDSEGADDGVKAVNSADALTKYDTVVLSHSDYTASILTLAAKDYAGNSVKIYNNKYYRLSVLVKTAKDNDGVATLRLIAWDNNTNKTTYSSLKAVESIATDGEWVEYVFYIGGAFNEKSLYNEAALQLLFGSGDAYTPSTHAKGTVYLTAVTFVEVSSSEFSSDNTGESISSYSFSANYYTTDTLTNGRFTNINYDKTLTANEGYSFSSAYDADGRLVGIGTPKDGWTAADAVFNTLSTPTVTVAAATSTDLYEKVDVLENAGYESVSHHNSEDSVNWLTNAADTGFILYHIKRFEVNLGSIVADNLAVTYNGYAFTYTDEDTSGNLTAGDIVTLTVSNSSATAYKYYFYNKTEGTAITLSAQGKVAADATKDYFTFTWADGLSGDTFYVYFETGELVLDRRLPRNGGAPITATVSNSTGIKYSYKLARVTKGTEEERTVTTTINGDAVEGFSKVERQLSWTESAADDFKYYEIKKNNTDVVAVISAKATVSYEIPLEGYLASDTYTVRAVTSHVLSWTKISANTDYFRCYSVYKDGVEDESLKVLGYSTGSVDIGGVYTLGAVYTVKAQYFVGDAKKNLTESVDLTWSLDLALEGATEAEAVAKNYYAYEVWFAADGGNEDDKFFLAKVDSHDSYSTSTANGVTTYKFVYSYTLTSLVDGTYYVRAIPMDIAAVDGTETDKYKPGAYASLEIKKSDYIATAAGEKYWNNVTSAAFSSFYEEYKASASDPSTDTFDSVPSAIVATFNDYTTVAPTESVTAAYSRGYSWAGIIDYAKFASATVFEESDSAVALSGYLTSSPIFPNTRSAEESAAGIWSYGLNNDTIKTISDKYSNMLMLASDVETIVGYKTSSTTTLTANSYYSIMFWVKTLGGAKATITLDNQSKIFNSEYNFAGFENIDTNGAWVQYRLLIKVGFTAAKIDLGLYLGNPSTNDKTYSSGIVLFDDISFIKLADKDAYDKYVTAAGDTNIKYYSHTLAAEGYVANAEYNAYNVAKEHNNYSNNFVVETLDYVTDSFDLTDDKASGVLGSAPDDYTQAMHTGDDSIKADNEARAYGVYNQSSMVDASNYASFLKNSGTYDDTDLRAQDWYTISTLANLRSYITGYGQNTLVLANFVANAQYYKSSAKTLSSDTYYKITFYAKAMLAENTFAEFRFYESSTAEEYTSVYIYGTNNTVANPYGFYEYSVYVANTSGADLTTAYYTFNLGHGAIVDADKEVTTLESELIMGLVVIDNVTVESITEEDYTAKVGADTDAVGSLKAAEADAATYKLARTGYAELTEDATEETTPTENTETETPKWDSQTWLIVSSAVVGFLIIVVVVLVMLKQFRKKYVKVKPVAESKVNLEKKADITLKQHKQESSASFMKNRDEFKD